MRINSTQKRIAATLITLGMSVVSISSQAQTSTSLQTVNNGSGINTRLFHAATDSKGFFSVNGTEVLAPLNFSLGLALDGGFGLLRVRETSSSTGITRDPTRIIGSQFHGVLFGSFSPFKNFVIGLGLPVDLVSGKPQPTSSSVPGIVDGRKTDVNAFFTGNWNINLKYRILRAEEDPIGLAVMFQADIPLSDDARQGFTADPGTALTPMLALEKRFGGDNRFRVGLNVGATFITGTGSRIGDLAAGDPGLSLQHGNHLRYGLGLSYRVIRDLDLVAETYGSYLLKNDAGGTAGLSHEAVAGLKIFVERNSYLFLGGGAGYLRGYQAADGRAFLGFIYEPSVGDRDGDGIKDDVDKCPAQPEDKDGFEDEDGCPDPDNDKDGIPDKQDACPNEPGPESNHGCPDPDSDGDGIPDSQDKCPNEPGPKSNQGCPVKVEPDSDGDGILDKDDKCPHEPGPKSNFGCPILDRDHDGIPDKDDKCPDEPENYNGFEDEDGCPDKGKVVIEGSNIIILEKILFDYNSAKIKPQSFPLLDQVAGTLKKHVEIVLVEVQGHADERGDDRYNLDLTQKRVDSVMNALIERGVEKARLRAKGFGEYCPIDEAHNEPAWEKNRRVEFKIVKTKDGPTGAELGCKKATEKGVKSDPVP